MDEGPVPAVSGSSSDDDSDDGHSLSILDQMRRRHLGSAGALPTFLNSRALTQPVACAAAPPLLGACALAERAKRRLGLRETTAVTPGASSTAKRVCAGATGSTIGAARDAVSEPSSFSVYSQFN